MNGGIGVPVHLLHPMVVHFPIALLVLGLGLGLMAEWGKGPDWFRPATAWALVGGTLSLWLAFCLGLLAERTAPHVPAAWKVMASHQSLAFYTASAFTLLAALDRFGVGPHRRRWVLVGWVFALGLLVFTAHLGATLVFGFGVGSL